MLDCLHALMYACIKLSFVPLPEEVRRVIQFPFVWVLEIKSGSLENPKVTLSLHQKIKFHKENVVKCFFHILLFFKTLEYKQFCLLPAINI